MMGIYMQLKWKERQRVSGGMGRLGREVSGLEQDSHMKNKPVLLLQLPPQQCKWSGWWRRTGCTKKKRVNIQKKKKKLKCKNIIFIRHLIWLRFTIIRRHLLSFWAPQHPSNPSRVITAPIVMLKIPTLTWLMNSSVKGGRILIKESLFTVTHIPTAARHMPASCQKKKKFQFLLSQIHYCILIVIC